MRKILAALFLLVAPSAMAQTSVQWGANKGSSPWLVCLYDAGHVCQSLFTLPATGGGPKILPGALPLATSSAFGGVKPDNSTITISGGILTASGGGSGCLVSGGSQYQIIVNNGSSGCSSDASASVNAGALTLGASGTVGSVTMGNATTGTATIQPVTGALGTVTASLPANTGIVAEINLAQPWSAIQTFNTNDLVINGGTATAGLATVTSGGVISSEALATVAQGGTNCSSASITCFNNITGLTAGGTSGTISTNLLFSGSPTIASPTFTGTVAGNGTIPTTMLSGTSTYVYYTDATGYGGQDGAFTFNDSTKALTLGLQGTTQGALVLANTNSTYATTIKASNSASAAWTMTLPVTAGTSTYVLQTDGSGGTSWVAQSGGGTGCAVSGSQYQIVAVSSAGNTCTPDTNATVNAGALTLGASGTIGTVTIGNATSGTVKLGAVTGALGTVTASFPANTGVVAELNLAQTWPAVQSFNSGDLILNGSSSGATTLNANATSGNVTATLPANTGIIAEINIANPWTVAQTFPAVALGAYSTTQGTLVLENTTAYPTTVQSSNSASAAWTMTLPVTAGSSGNVLQTNGSGVTSWAAPNAGLYVNAVTTCGVDNTGATDVTTGSGNASLSTCLTNYGAVALPAGSYKIANASNCVTIPSGASLIGAGVGQTIFTNTTTTGNSVCMTVSGQHMLARDFSITHTGGTPTAGCGFLAGSVAGTTAGVGESTIEYIRITNGWNGFCLGGTDDSFCNYCFAESNYAQGFYFNNSVSYQTLQWGLNNTLSGQNNGWGYYFNAVTGATNTIQGTPWIGTQSFANAGGGYLFIANGTAVINDIALYDIIASTDGGGGEIYLSTNGGTQNLISGGLIELAGTTATGISGGTSAAHTGSGIAVVGTIGALTVSGTTISGNYYSGLAGPSSGSARITITGNQFADNSRVSSGTYAGISGAGSSNFYNISNNSFTQGTNQTQPIGITGGSATIMGNMGDGTCSNSGPTLKPSGTSALYNFLTSCP